MKNLIGKINKYSTMQIVERGEYGNEYYDVIGIVTDYHYFNFTIYDKEAKDCLEGLGFEDLPNIRKSWLDLYKEAKEVPFIRGIKNWYVQEESEGIVSLKYYERLRLPMKFISKEDAEYVVRECKENNGGK